MNRLVISSVRLFCWTLISVVGLVPVSAIADIKGRCVSNCGPDPVPGTSGGGYSAPGYNYEAERQRQEAERERVRQEEAERQEKFDREKREAAATLKGVSGGGGNELKGISGSNSHGLKGLDFGAGAQLKSIERHSRDATGPLTIEGSSDEARKGFDEKGKRAGTLVYPDVSRKKPVAHSALASRIPAAAQNDPEVKNSLAWYGQLDKVKAEAKQKIADAEKQQKSGTGDKAALSAHIQSLNTQLKDAEQQQAKTEEKVKARVRNLGFAWNEAPAPTTGSSK